MQQNDFFVLNQRKIIDILIGDLLLEEKQDYRVQMPYLSGTDLCSLSTKFGIPALYPMGGGAPSRWMYMQKLLEHATDEGTTSKLLRVLFDLSSFNKLLEGMTEKKDIEIAYKYIVKMVISVINNELLFSKKELYTDGHDFYIFQTNSPRIIEKKKLDIINVPYIHELDRRIENDIISENYDSVITKSRTMIEEVLLYIIEQKGIEGKFSGDILKMYSAVKDGLGMRQDNEKDKRINTMLSGLEKIIQSITEMRNAQSDAHGVGQKRINIRKHEAQLTANSAITFSEYIFSVFEFQSGKSDNQFGD